MIQNDNASGILMHKNDRVRWILSKDGDDGHTVYYDKILAGRGFGLAHARNSIEIAYAIRNGAISAKSSDYHPFLSNQR